MLVPLRALLVIPAKTVGKKVLQANLLWRNDDSGALSAVPGSHHWLDREPPPLRHEPVPGEQTLRLPAGSMVIIHSNLWHRALSTRTGKRRVLILSYTPCWLRESPHGGPAPDDGLTRKLIADGDEEIRELLGLTGHS